MTYQEAINQGYKLGKTTYQMGYVSRKIDIGKQDVLETKR